LTSHLNGSEIEPRVQYRADGSPAWTPEPAPSHHSAVRVLAHIKKLDDCFGDFLVRVTCVCGAVREITPAALARLVGWKVTLERVAQQMRCSHCGKRAVESSRPRGHGRVACRSIRISRY